MPRYTEEAIKRGTQGKVLACASIDEHGNVGSVLLLSHLGYGLDERAEEYVRKLKFLPATKAGKPHSVFAKIEITFALR